MTIQLGRRVRIEKTSLNLKLHQQYAYKTMKEDVGSLVIMTSKSGSESLNSIPHAANDPRSARGIRAREISGFESPVVSR